MCTLSPSFTTASSVMANSLLFWKVTSTSANILNIFSDSTLQALKASKVKKSGRYLLSFIVFIINHLVNYQYLSNRLRGQRFHLPIRSSDQFLRLSKQNRYGRYKKYDAPEYQKA